MKLNKGFLFYSLLGYASALNRGTTFNPTYPDMVYYYMILLQILVIELDMHFGSDPMMRSYTI